MDLDPATLLRLVLEVGDADVEHDWYLTALIPTGDDPAHASPDPAALDHLDTSVDLVGLYGWALYRDAECIAVYTSDNTLHRNRRTTPVSWSNSIWEAVSLTIEAFADALPPSSAAMPG